MPAWILVLIIVCAAGLAAIGYGAVHDRRLNRRLERRLTEPPDRGLAALATAPGPRYVSAADALRRPAPARHLDPQQARIVRDLLSTAPHWRVGVFDRTFIDEPDHGAAVLVDPVVLVCGEPVTTIRELLGAIDLVRRHARPLVLVVPDAAAEVVRTLAANRVQGLLDVAVIGCPDLATLLDIAQRTAATVIDRADLQAGYLPPEAFGRVGLWVSTLASSWALMPSPREAETAQRDAQGSSGPPDPQDAAGDPEDRPAADQP